MYGSSGCCYVGTRGYQDIRYYCFVKLCALVDPLRSVGRSVGRSLQPSRKRVSAFWRRVNSLSHYHTSRISRSLVVYSTLTHVPSFLFF